MTEVVKLTNDRKIVQEQDTDCESPNDWGNEDMFLVYDHRQFTVEREGFEPSEIFDYTQTLDIDSPFHKYWVFPVAAYIHSGVSLSLGVRHGWDISNTGFILVSKKDFDYDLQRESVEGLKNKTDEEVAIYYAKGLIDTWNTYLSGEVYRISLVQVIKCENCGHEEEETIDALGGVYLDDTYTLELAASEHFGIEEKEILKE